MSERGEINLDQVVGDAVTENGRPMVVVFNGSKGEYGRYKDTNFPATKLIPEPFRFQLRSIPLSGFFNQEPASSAASTFLKRVGLQQTIDQASQNLQFESRNLGYLDSAIFPRLETAVIWVCRQERSRKLIHPRDNQLLNKIWEFSEQLLVRESPDLRWILTPSIERSWPRSGNLNYSDQTWQEFLAHRGYVDHSQDDLIKHLRTPFMK